MSEEIVYPGGRGSGMKSCYHPELFPKPNLIRRSITFYRVVMMNDSGLRRLFLVSVAWR